MNILLITLDQFRGDCLSAAGHPVVETPNLDRLAREGVRLARHYSQAAPCGPGRASLYTGMYQLNHRVVANGTPLDARFDNVARAARRAGYAPTLFGYTDQSVDPRETSGPDDPRLRIYEGVLPGFDVGLELDPVEFGGWMGWLRDRGHDVGDDWRVVLASEPERPAELSLAAFFTDRFIDWLGAQRTPWFAHLSQLRPHPPYAAAGRFSRLYESAAMPRPIAPAPSRHRVHDRLLRQERLAAPGDPSAMAALQVQYYGMIAESDAQLGRVWDALEANGQWNDTFIVVTADHGEQMGDHGLIEKAGWFEQSYHVLGIARDPRAPQTHGTVVERFTENVDVLPTLCEAMNMPIPAQCDGRPLTGFLSGEAPLGWRTAAHWEWDWRASFIPLGPHDWPADRRLETSALAVLRTGTAAYVQFADGDALAFDLAADPTWRTELTDPAAVLALARAMLAWRMEHADRTLTGMLVEGGGIGRWPIMPAGWGSGDPNLAAESLSD
jgi:arylsulfatase A-like enzyme